MDNNLGAVPRLVTAYVALTLATVAALLVLSATAPRLATDDAWVHALIVLALGGLLLLRLHRARAGSRPALRAVGVIATVLLVANLVEAAVPGLFPTWMRVEMVAIAFLMLVLALAVRRQHSA